MPPTNLAAASISVSGGATSRTIAARFGERVNVKDFGAVGNNVADDTTAINNAFAAAITLGTSCYLPKGTYKTSAVVRWNNAFPRISGDGMTQTILAPTGVSYHGLHVGTGSGVGDGAYVMDLAVIGPSANPTATYKAAFCLDAVLFCGLERLYAANHDIGFDFKNICYGSYGLGLRAPNGSCNVGLNLRSGTQSGSDLPFYNYWGAGGVAGVHISPSSGGFHFFGGQLGSGYGTSQALSVAPAVLGKDYEAGTTGYTNATFDGIDFEGWARTYALRLYEECDVFCSNCSFLGTTTGADMAAGILQMDAWKNSKVRFENCGISGSFSAATLRSYAAPYYDEASFNETPWRTRQPLTINGVAAQTIHSLEASAQGNLGGCSPWRQNWGGTVYTTWKAGGMLFRVDDASSVFEKSANYGSSWAAV